MPAGGHRKRLVCSPSDTGHLTQLGFADRQRTNPATGFLDNDDRTRFERFTEFESCAESLNHIWSARIVKAKKNHAYDASTRECNDFPEIEIKRQDNTVFRVSFAEDPESGRRCRPRSPKVNGLMFPLVEPVDDLPTDSHVRKKPHEGLPSLNLFLSKPGSVLNGLLDIVTFEIRISFKDFLKCRPVSDLSNNHRNRNTHAADACPAAHDVGVECDPVEHRTDGQYTTRSLKFVPWEQTPISVENWSCSFALCLFLRRSGDGVSNY
jgi:hypothetical protein